VKKTLPPLALALFAFPLLGLLAAGDMVARAAAPPFPSSGLDPWSLGRGGTVIAVPGTFETVLGNPACLFPTKALSISANLVRPRGADAFYSLGAADGRGGFRAAFLHLSDSASLGFSGRVWGAALSESIGSSITVGQSIHTATLPGVGGSPDKTVTCGDLGVAVSPMGRVVLGYVARGFYRSDRQALARREGYGVRISLPWTIDLSAEMEESAQVAGEQDTRVGLEAEPWQFLTVRGGDGTAPPRGGREPHPLYPGIELPRRQRHHRRSGFL
jgi:hypothetical protein